MSETVRVITTCTSRKLGTADTALVPSLPGLDLPGPSVAAEDLYTGEQHRRLMRGVRQAQSSHPVEVWVISAKAGLIAGRAEIEPYDESFAGMAPDRLRALAEDLGIPGALRTLLGTPVRLTLMLVGNDYFDAAALERPIDWASPTLLLARSSSRCTRLIPHPNLAPIAVSQALAKRWSLPLTLLKGEIVGRMLCSLAAGNTPEALFSDRDMREHLLVPSGQSIAC